MTVEKLEIRVTTNAGDAASKINSLSSALRGVSGTASKSASSGVRSVGTAAKNATKHTSQFAASLTRIAKYRLLRTVIKEITQAFSEGLKNAYNFSAGINGSLASALDSLSSKALTMKNQLGAAFGGLLETITPILLRIIELVRMAAQAISAFFAAIGGGQYLVANDVAASWDKATGAAKKYRNTILGFDEINRLDEPSGGGGGSAVDASNMFHVEELPGWAQKVKDLFADIDLKAKVKDFVFDWSDLSAEKIAKKALTGLVTLTSAAAGFAIGGVPGAIVGTLTGFVISALLEKINFNNDGVLGENEVYGLIADALFAFTGGIIGAAVGGVPGALVGASLGFVASLLIKSLLFGETSETGFGYSLATALTSFVGGIIGFAFGGLPGSVLGASIGFGVSLLITKLNFGQTTMTGFGYKLADAITAFIGAVVGFVFGGVPGALLGAAIGIGFSLAIKKVLFGEGGAKISGEFLRGLAEALTVVTGIAIGLLAGGIPGAILGAAIGVAITLVAKSVQWDSNARNRVAAAASINPIDFREDLVGFASGGTIENNGTLFLAGEAGPEIVANMGSSTGVMNVGQMEAAVANGNDKVVSAVYSMANAIVTAINNKDSDISIDSESVARLMYRPMQMENKRRGQSLVSGGVFA